MQSSGLECQSDQSDDQSLEDPFIANRMVRDAFGVTAFSTIAHMMDQSFLQGVISFTQLISSGDITDDFEKKVRALGIVNVPGGFISQPSEHTLCAVQAGQRLLA